MTAPRLNAISRVRLSRLAEIPEALGNSATTTIVFDALGMTSGKVTLGTVETDFICQAIREKLARTSPTFE